MISDLTFPCNINSLLSHSVCLSIKIGLLLADVEITNKMSHLHCVYVHVFHVLSFQKKVTLEVPQ